MTRKLRINIENVVASAKLGAELPLGKIAAKLEDVEYEPEHFPGMVYRMERPETSTLIFKSGKLVCTGAKSPEDSTRVINRIARKIREAGIKIGKPEIQVQNIVASAELGTRLDIDSVATALVDAEYEPEQFPGLVYRMKDPRVVLLLFGSGRLVCTGAKRPSDIERAVRQMMKMLKSKRLM